ncbi:GNAT family N-acetyltransferase [Anaerococcus sp. AGMB09787]|uniref:GNAT family N-acetyltransferase n=1 Tax=Anaerococcus sp. AGMB09787 TaxID=2922869 RepID=UPI00243440B0|nr:GNAT family N-acetyltransferase [Anaerococcus sp. AGMB09787]
MCITIATTDACNLNCPYCFEKHGKNFLKEKCIPSICELIREYKKSNSNVTRVVVIWFGGEPLLNLNFIIEASHNIKKTCQELSLNYSGRIITNGLVLDKLIPYIKELCITDIQITLDGTKELHDSRRISPNGTGSFDTIISNIEKIKTKIDLIIRMNIDKTNLSECIRLYDYLIQLSVNQSVSIFFQPMLVENYGGESTCYEGMVLDDEELNEEYLDLLEYTNSLENPKYIGAFCNVDFLGSVVIRPDTSLCKCWAEVAETSETHISINSKTKNILHFMKQPIYLGERKSCKTCIIYPTCLGGCKYRNYTISECDTRRRVVLSTISRLFLKEKTIDDVFYKILNNELLWLRSIGSKIHYKNEGIKVSRFDLNTTDFNFYIGIDYNEKCIRLSQEMKNFRLYDNYLVRKGYERDPEYDINYYYSNSEEDYVDEKYSFEENTLDVWGDYGFTRKNSRHTKFYFIRYGKDIIGKFFVITDIIGIYDFKIYENYQNIGHGTEVLRSLMKLTSKDLFIQTWSENYAAQRCYERAGFTKFELVYRYIRTD